LKHFVHGKRSKRFFSCMGRQALLCTINNPTLLNHKKHHLFFASSGVIADSVRPASQRAQVALGPSLQTLFGGPQVKCRSSVKAPSALFPSRLHPLVTGTAQHLERSTEQHGLRLGLACGLAAASVLD
jgi:hypothetical protein